MAFCLFDEFHIGRSIAIVQGPKNPEDEEGTKLAERLRKHLTSNSSNNLKTIPPAYKVSKTHRICAAILKFCIPRWWRVV